MEAIARRHARPVPADVLLHPIAIASLGLLIVNDHVLKGAFPGPITGKLSDFAGLVIFPLALVATWELLRSLTGRKWMSGRLSIGVAVAVTGAVFAAVKLVPPATALVSELFGVGQWLLTMPADGPLPTRIMTDATDLVALPALLIAYVIVLRRREHGNDV